MRRRLQRLDQQFTRSRALQAIEFVGIHNRIAAVQGDVLRPIAVGQTNPFAEPRLGVLQAPARAWRRPDL
jgi:hypothetical protein